MSGPLEAAGLSLLIVAPLMGMMWAIIQLLWICNVNGDTIVILVSLLFIAGCIASSIFIGS